MKILTSTSIYSEQYSLESLQSHRLMRTDKEVNDTSQIMLHNFKVYMSTTYLYHLPFALHFFYEN